jgi:hypothetical protein
MYIITHWFYFILLAPLWFPNFNEQPAVNKPVTHESPVVLELFTSQGCASCPSADRLLSELIKQAKAEDRPVYGLSFHVSYWNYLGWPDPYSQKQFNERQTEYARHFGTSSVYTPQLIVNGQQQFVGSNRQRARATISEAMKRDYEPLISKATSAEHSDSLSIQLKLLIPDEPVTLNLAVVEQELSNYIPRGENSGLTLNHDNVVRYFQSFQPLQSTTTTRIPKSMIGDLARSEVIIYIQHTESHTILDAVSLRLRDSN